MNSPLTIQIRNGIGGRLPIGTAGEPYSVELSASGGSGGYRWELLNRSSAISWLMLDKDTGVLSGQPDAETPGVVSLILNVTDSNGVTAQRVLSLMIGPRTQ